MPMQRRLPKRGFANPFRVEAHPINIGLLSDRFSDGEVVDVELLRKSGLVPKKAKVIKVLGGGAIDKKLIVHAHRFSKSAVSKIEAAGGTTEVVAKRLEKSEESAKQEAPVTE